MTDLDDLEDISEQNKMSTGRKDARGSKKGAFKIKMAAYSNIRSRLRGAQANSLRMRLKNVK